MKFMNLKRFGATVMAGVMALSLAVPAFATSTVVDGSYNPITLAVTVPKTGKAIINPYGLPYNLDENNIIKNEPISNGSVLMLENRSKVALKVTGKVTGEAKDGLTLITTSTPTENAAKQALVNVEVFEALGITEANLSDTETVINPKFAALKSADAKLKAVVDPAAAANLTGAGDFILREGNADGELQNGGAAFFRLSGKATKEPDADNAWKKEDGFTVTIAFTFTPDEYPPLTVATQLVPSAASLSLAGTKQGTVGTAAVLPTGVTAKSTVYSTDDATVLKVNDKTGAYEGLKIGSAKLIATIEGSDGLPYKSEVSITVTA